jgi:hypothetical protein
MNCHSVPYAGRLEYLHCSPANHRRQQKGNLVSGNITGPSRHWVHKYRDLVLQVGCWMQGWQPCSVKKNTVVKSKEVKTRLSNSWWNRQVWQNLLRKAVAENGPFCWQQWWQQWRRRRRTCTAMEEIHYFLYQNAMCEINGISVCVWYLCEKWFCKKTKDKSP